MFYFAISPPKPSCEWRYNYTCHRLASSAPHPLVLITRKVDRSSFSVFRVQTDKIFTIFNLESWIMKFFLLLPVKHILKLHLAFSSSSVYVCFVIDKKMNSWLELAGNFLTSTWRYRHENGRKSSIPLSLNLVKHEFCLWKLRYFNGSVYGRFCPFWKT